MSISEIDPTKPVDGVPAVKADLRANLVAIKGALETPILKNFAEPVQSPAIVGGALTFSLQNGNVGEVTLNANVTSMAFQNAPQSGLAGSLTLILRQDGTGGRTVAWPVPVTWMGAVPSMPAAAGAVLVVAFLTTDGGTSWLGFKGGST